LSADGATSAQLPDVSCVAIAGARLPEPAQRQESIVINAVATLKRRFAIVPSQPGPCSCRR
jgi:hypothetical protein